MAPYVRDKRHLVGLILVLIGIVLIIDNLRFVPHFIPWWIWTWQFLLITIGAFSLLTTDRVGPGLVLISIGSIFLLSDILPDAWPQFFHWFSDDSNLFWYIVLIIIGASLILRKGGLNKTGPTQMHSRKRRFSGKADQEPGALDTEASNNDYIDEVAIFGGGKKVITSNNFRGGRITTIFGGSELVFTQSQLASGINEIEVFAMFGGWTLVVPRHWQVKSEVIAIFGGISDKRLVDAESMKDNTRQLIIKGFVMFGGGEIKSY